MVVNKRFLLIALVGVAVGALLAAVNLSEHPSTVVYREVDMAGLFWSGRNEGETVTIEPAWSTSVAGPSIPPFNRFSLVRGIEEATNRLGGRVPLLPTLLPENIKYADVYIGPDVIIVYGCEEAKDFWSGNIGIEIGPAPARVPTPEETRAHLYPDQKLVEIGDMWITITDQAHDWNRGDLYVLATFYHSDLYYKVAALSPLTIDDVTKIIGSMKAPS